MADIDYAAERRERESHEANESRRERQSYRRDLQWNPPNYSGYYLLSCSHAYHDMLRECVVGMSPQDVREAMAEASSEDRRSVLIAAGKALEAAETLRKLLVEAGLLIPEGERLRALEAESERLARVPAEELCY